MKTAHLVYSILCDDVRLELGNKLSLMGLFENVFLPSFPATLLKCAVVNHWMGAGDFETQVKVLMPDGREAAVSALNTFRIEAQGYADNVTFFANVHIERPGMFIVRTLLDGKMVSERPLYVHQLQQPPTTVN